MTTPTSSETSWADHYAILGVPFTADEDEIGRAYIGDTTTNRKIYEAFNILSDPSSRAKFDLERQAYLGTVVTMPRNRHWASLKYLLFFCAGFGTCMFKDMLPTFNLTGMLPAFEIDDDVVELLILFLCVFVFYGLVSSRVTQK